MHLWELGNSRSGGVSECLKKTLIAGKVLAETCWTVFGDSELINSEGKGRALRGDIAKVDKGEPYINPYTSVSL